MRVLFLEPFFGGSHRDFAEGWAAHSRFDIDLRTLPARFWKWRMRGAALEFHQTLPPLDDYDALIITDLMSLSDFRALRGGDCPPALVYFHENQLSYPVAPGERMDVHFGFTDITTALAADCVVFNSRTHSDTFFADLPGFIGRMPEYRPHWVADAIRAKTRVLTPGCRFSADMTLIGPDPDSPPAVVWNHRWEFDKAPEAFFAAVDRVAERGVTFDLIILGENFSRRPEVFEKARQRHGKRLRQFGYVPSRKAYLDWLRRGTAVVGTAVQENFGISVVEAVRCGCLPLLPNRLSYPEILPEAFHESFLYQDANDLADKLATLLTSRTRFQKERAALSRHMAAHAWEVRVEAFDNLLAEVAAADRRTARRASKPGKSPALT